MEGLCRGWGKVGLDQTGACLASRRPLPRQGSLLGTRNGGDLSCTRPNFAGGRSRPQTGACLPSRRLRSLKQAPVYSCADCVAPNRRLFSFAQTAGPQTGACLLSRRLRSPKQAPVWHYTKCRNLNRRLFAFECGIMVVQKALSGEQRGIAEGRRPDKDFGWLFTFASDKGFLE